MKTTILPAALIALLACATPAFAQNSALSSPEDKRHLVTIVHNLETTPLSGNARADRAWGIQFVTDAPDITVNACLDPLGNVTNEHYAYSSEIIVQYMLGMAAFIVEHPDAANDPDAQQLAGVESAVKAYRSMRTAAPNDKSSPAFEELLAKQGRGELPAFVHTAYRSCMAKNGK